MKKFICRACRQGDHRGCTKFVQNRFFETTPCSCGVCQKAAKVKRVWSGEYPSAQNRGFPVDHIRWSGPRHIKEISQQKASLQEIWDLAVQFNGRRMK